MGSVISAAIAAAFPHRDDFLLADEDDPNGGPFFHELPLHQQERLKQRWMEKLERKNPRAVVWGTRSRECCGDCNSNVLAYIARRERIAAELLPHVQIALQHYNSNNPGAEFDPVKPLTYGRVGFRNEIWFHINFLARPRTKRNFFARSRDALPDAAAQHFFAELHYDQFDTPVVEMCTILENPLERFKRKCAFCKGPSGVFHPSNGEFVCGKSNQKKEYYQICIWRAGPKKGASSDEEATSVKKLFEHLPLAA